MKSNGPQKSQFSNSLVNWEKFGCKLRLKFKKQQQLFIFFMDRKKFRIPDGTTLKQEVQGLQAFAFLR